MSELTALPRDGAKTPVVFGGLGEGMPQLNLKVVFVGNCFLAGAIRMFRSAGCEITNDIREAELAVFLGGEDVDPALYGEKALRGTYFNRERDDREVEAFKFCQLKGIPMFGICRGMQFLHVMNGGKLYQHVHSHAGGNHGIRDERTGEIVMVSSMHHQMCIEDDMTFPIAYAEQPGHSGTYIEASKEVSDPRHRDLEAAVYPAINAICVQGHPEVGPPAFTKWSLEQISEFLDELSLMGNNARPMAEVSFINNRAVKDV